jgi:hypothetical protein
MPDVGFPQIWPPMHSLVVAHSCNGIPKIGSVEQGAAFWQIVPGEVPVSVAQHTA